MSPQKRQKRYRNESYAAKYQRRDKATKKKLRRERVETRERRWLEQTERGRGAWWTE